VRMVRSYGSDGMGRREGKSEKWRRGVKRRGLGQGQIFMPNGEVPLGSRIKSFTRAVYSASWVRQTVQWTEPPRSPLFLSLTTTQHIRPSNHAPSSLPLNTPSSLFVRSSPLLGRVCPSQQHWLLTTALPFPTPPPHTTLTLLPMLLILCLPCDP